MARVSRKKLLEDVRAFVRSPPRSKRAERNPATRTPAELFAYLGARGGMHYTPGAMADVADELGIDDPQEREAFFAEAASWFGGV